MEGLNKFLNKDKACVIMSYALAACLLAAIVYFLPGVFIGLVAGTAIGKNYDKIMDWVNNK